jgi:hypothetical protein
MKQTQLILTINDAPSHGVRGELAAHPSKAYFRQV